jgi:uncharacterized protein YsxB (DUF464 family)
MTCLNPVESVIDVTKHMQNKEKFAYINVPKSSIVGLSKNSENSFPQFFARNILSALKNNDKKMLKAVSHTLMPDIETGKHFKIGLNKNNKYYYSNIFEYYYLNNREVYNTLIDFFIKNSKTLTISFHDKKLIQKHLGYNTHVINVPFNNYYEKLDNIYAQISEFDGGVDYCIMDCGILGLALTPKIWENLNMSIIDLGKTINLFKTSL